MVSNTSRFRQVLGSLGLGRSTIEAEMTAFTETATHIPLEAPLLEQLAYVKEHQAKATSYLEDPHLSGERRQEISSVMQALMALDKKLTTADGKLSYKDGEALLALEQEIVAGPPEDVKQSQDAVVSWFSDKLKEVGTKIKTTPDTKPEMMHRLESAQEVLTRQHEKAQAIQQHIRQEAIAGEARKRKESRPGYKDSEVKRIQKLLQDIDLDPDYVGDTTAYLVPVRTLQKSIMELVNSPYLAEGEAVTEEEGAFLQASLETLDRQFGAYDAEEVEVGLSATSFKARFQDRLGEDTPEPPVENTPKAS
ncbi:MAG: hypothetical protein P1U32_05370 [Legionellaceae bacterium]|nr:hypothetical protein [Legionellaceae bacterium]